MNSTILSNIWHCVGLSKNVTTYPQSTKIGNRSIVVWRSPEDGRLMALDDACPHRGAPLSAGMVCNNSIVCPYHAWHFDGDTGDLLEIPSDAKKVRLPIKNAAKKVVVRESGGFVFALNDPQGDKLPSLPVLRRDICGKAAYGEVEFEAMWVPVIQNSIDFSHIHSLHSFGNYEKQGIEDMVVHKKNASEIRASFKIHNTTQPGFWIFKENDPIRVHITVRLPATSIITFTLRETLSFTTIVCVTPTSDTTSISRFCLVRHLKAPKVVSSLFEANCLDWMASGAMSKVVKEDKQMVDRLHTLDTQLSAPSDMVQLEYMKMVSNWASIFNNN
jgi:phenylpropionate dioxygenase-like ring-hydroxylating dioxygenase large terminal subunit